jgi:hypothetical protein
MRIDFPEGQWVEVRERITHGQDKEIRRARVRVRDDPEHTSGEDVTVALRVFVSAWSVKDVDGIPIAIGDLDAVDRLPMDIADPLFETVATLYLGATVPNPPTPASSDGSSSDSP